MIGKCYKRHRATEFLDFLNRIDAEMPKGPDMHLVMDNYATHKTAKIKAWRRAVHIGMSTSPRHPLPGSIKSSAGSPN
ncbi:hypothetical protein TomTYG45_28470 [Sphingobium sp. TomTYG45]